MNSVSSLKLAYISMASYEINIGRICSQSISKEDILVKVWVKRGGLPCNCILG